MWAAFVYDELRRQGDLVLPVGRLDLGGGLQVWPALLTGVAVAAALGLILHVAVFRPLRSAPPLAKVVASVGVAITLQALVVLRFGTGRRAVPPALPDDPVRLGSLSFSEDRIWFAGVVAVIALLLWAYGRYTRSGLATRAAAESERGAILLGLVARSAGGRHVGAGRRGRRHGRHAGGAVGGARPRELDPHGRAGPGLRARGPADVGRRRLRGGSGARRSRVGDHVPVVQGLVARLGDGGCRRDGAPAGHRGRPVRARTAASGTGIGRRRPAAAGPDTPRPAAARRRSRGRGVRRSAAHRRQLPVRRDHVDDRGAHGAVAGGPHRLRGPDLAGAGGVRRLGRLRPLEDRDRAAVPAVAARRRARPPRRWGCSWRCPPCGCGASSSRWSRWPPASPSSSSSSRTPS